jgi:hypothetical protein
MGKMDAVCRHIGHMTMYDFHDLSVDLGLDGNELSYIPEGSPRTGNKGVGEDIGTRRESGAGTGPGYGSGAGPEYGSGTGPGDESGPGPAGSGGGDMEIEGIIRSMRMVVNDRTRVRRLCRHQQLSILSLRLLLKAKNEEIFS